MIFCQVATTVTFLLIRHQVTLADQDNVTFTEDNLTTVDYENGTSTTEYPNTTMKNVSFIPEGYDRGLPSKDTKVVIELSIRSIVQDKNSQYCNLTFEVWCTWNDERLFAENPWWKNHKYNITTEMLRNIWNPRLVLIYRTISEGDIHNTYKRISKENQTANLIYDNRNILYSIRNSNLTLRTKPNFRKFPADRHQHMLRLIPLDSQNYSRSYFVSSFPQLDNDLVFDIDVKGMSFNDSIKWWLSNNNLAVIITFQRRIGNYIVQSYIPSGLFIIISWLSMFLPLDIATERVALCTATLLTLTTFTGAAKLSVPETSYMTGLDLWMVVSTLFIFLVLVENICVLRIMAKKSGVLRTGIFEGIVKTTTKIHVAEILKSEKENVTSLTSNQKQDAVQEIGETNPIKVTKPEEWRTFARKLDIISAVVIAVLWIIFNVIYWIWLFANEDLFSNNTPVKVSDQSVQSDSDIIYGYE